MPRIETVRVQEQVVEDFHESDGGFVSSSDGVEEVDDDEEVSWYIAEENDTPDKIATHFHTVSAEHIVELNKARFPGLTVSSRLRKNAHIKLRNEEPGEEEEEVEEEEEEERER